MDNNILCSPFFILLHCFSTDRVIQDLLRTHFGYTTILIIAHRLQTLQNVDKVMVRLLIKKSHGEL